MARLNKFGSQNVSQAETGYELGVTRKSLKRERLNNICLITEDKNFRDTRFYSHVMMGIENEAKRSSYDIIMCIKGEGPQKIPTCIQQGKVKGIIILGSIDEDYLKLVISSKLPLITVDYASYSVNTNAVLTQNLFGSYKATEYLIKNGHRSIGFLGDKNSTMSFNERWIGFVQAMQHYNLSVPQKYCITDNVEQYALNDDFEALAAILRDMEDYPTAWVCANDSAATILINAANSIGLKIPDDFSAIGFDDINLCEIIMPKLTTMRVSKNLMGINAMRCLMRQIKNPNTPPSHLSLAVDLVERETVKKI